jgi:hypothetical protein
MTKITKPAKAMSGRSCRVVAEGTAAAPAVCRRHPATGVLRHIESQARSGRPPDKDGPDGQALHLGRFMNTPVEAVELEIL